MGKLDEVVYLVEWPVVLEGRFDERYLVLPERVPDHRHAVASALLPDRAPTGGSTPASRSSPTAATPTVVAAGNEEVLVGRLEDAVFAHDKDLGPRHRRDAGRAAAASASWRARARWPTRRSGCASCRGSCATGSRPSRRCARPWRGRRSCARPTWCRAWWRSSPTCRGTPGRCTRARRVSRAEVCDGDRGAPPPDRGRRGAAGRRGGRAALGRRQGRHRGGRVRAGRPADRQPRSVRAAAGRGRHGRDRARARLRAGPGRSDGRVGAHAGRAGPRAASASRSRRCPTPSSSCSTGSSRLMAEEGVTVEEMRAARGSGVTGPLPLAALCRALARRARSRRLAAVRDAYGRCMRITAKASRAGGAPTCGRRCSRWTRSGRCARR